MLYSDFLQKSGSGNVQKTNFAHFQKYYRISYVFVKRNPEETLLKGQEDFF